MSDAISTVERHLLPRPAVTLRVITICLFVGFVAGFFFARSLP